MVKRCVKELEWSNDNNNSAQGTMFIDTNLDTHLVIPVSDSDTFSLLKRSKMKRTKGGQNLDKTRSSQLKNVSMDTIFRSSNRFKKAKLTAEAQPEDSESQPIDYVPDSQAYLY